MMPVASAGTRCQTMEQQSSTKDPCCGRCGYGGCDVRVVDCGCCLHARCTPVSENSVFSSCPRCNRPAPTGLQLLPMSFEELDEARRAAAALSMSGKRGKKRKSATIARLNPEGSATGDDSTSGGNDTSDLRTGRWTAEETLYCDKLIEKFEAGQLPVADGVKLNDFLANMLKSKQSRLTKKMKNAKLSTKLFKRWTGHITDPTDARRFSETEDAFFRSIQCSMERAEIRFHMQKEWRELFSNFCVQIGQTVDADAWLYSVEEVDRRMSQAKDAARMARRKLMMGYALSKDAANPDQGVFIDRVGSIGQARKPSGSAASHANETDDLLNLLLQNGSAGSINQPTTQLAVTSVKTKKNQPSPFLSKVIAFIKRQNIPFESVDAWVPSFVPNDTTDAACEPSCRLCYAGSATSDVQLSPDGWQSIPMSAEDQFDLLAFGEYSQKFSFDVGCGLPGRVYQTGVSSWEQNVQNAPHNHFERCGGAVQWKIKTVLGVPVPSPNVGRIVVVFYSRHDRHKNQDMVTKLCDGLAKFLPSPKWKLVVDIGTEKSDCSVSNGNTTQASEATNGAPSVDNRVTEIVSLLGELMPTEATSPYLSGFTSLRLMMLNQSKSPRENEMIGSLLGSYSAYASTGRPKSDIALLLVRDFVFLSQQQQQQQQPLQQIAEQFHAAPSNMPVIGNASLYPLGHGNEAIPTRQTLASAPQPNPNVGQVSQHSYAPQNHGGVPSVSMR